MKGRVVLLRKLAALGVLAGLALATPSWAAAQSGKGDGAAEYDRLIDAGLAEYEAHDFLEARALFAKAHALSPNARTLRVLGMVEFELRNYPQCIEYLQQSLVSRVKPLDQDLREEVQTLLGRAEAFVARVRVEVQPASAKPQILIDGAPLQAAADAPIVLQVGDHVIEARADHYRAEKRTLSVKGGEEQELRIELHRELLQAANDAEPRPLYKSPWLWAGAGVVAIGAGIALALLLQPSPKTEVGAPVTTSQTPPGGVKILAHGSF